MRAIRVSQKVLPFFLAFSLFSLKQAYAEAGPEPVLGYFYFSSSEGDDNNHCQSEVRPCQSLAKVSELNLLPGSKVLLKRGDIWNEAIVWEKGKNGTGDSRTGDWIQIEPYGDGADPVIDRAGATDADKDFAIKLVDMAGIEIRGLAIRNVAFGVADLNTDPAAQRYGFIVKDCTFSNISGVPYHAPTPAEDERTYWWSRGPTAVLSAGVGPCVDGLPATRVNCGGDEGRYVIPNGSNLNDVAFENLKINTAGYGVVDWAGMGTYGKNHYIKNLEVDQAAVVGLQVTFAEDVLIKDAVITRTGWGYCHTGSAGVDVNYCKNLAISGGEFAYTIGDPENIRDHPVGINFNGLNERVRVVGADIHDNGGSAIAAEYMEGSLPATYDFSYNRVRRNGLFSFRSGGHEEQEYPQFLTVVASEKDRGVHLTARGNFIQMRSPEEYLMVIAEDFVHNPLRRDMVSDSYYSFCGNRWKLEDADEKFTLVDGNKECSGTE